MAENFSTSQNGNMIRKTGKGTGPSTSVKAPVKPKTNVDSVEIPSTILTLEVMAKKKMEIHSKIDKLQADHEEAVDKFAVTNQEYDGVLSSIPELVKLEKEAMKAYGDYEAGNMSHALMIQAGQAFEKAAQNHPAMADIMSKYAKVRELNSAYDEERKKLEKDLEALFLTWIHQP